jgi:phage gp36-like protein
MAYITTTDLSNRLGTTIYARLTDRVNGNSADANVAQQIIDDAEAQADSYFARRYATPIDLSAHSELSDIITARVSDLAEYIAWRQSPFVGDLSDRVRALYDETLRWFKAVAGGKIELPAASLPASRTATDDGPWFTATDRRFTGEELDGL